MFLQWAGIAKPSALLKPNKNRHPAIIVAHDFDREADLRGGYHGPRHDRGDEVEGRDAASAAKTRSGATTRQ